MRASRSFRHPRTRIAWDIGFNVVGVQEMEGETPAAAENMVVRRVEAGCGKCAGSYCEFTHELVELGAIERHGGRVHYCKKSHQHGRAELVGQTGS